MLCPRCDLTMVQIDDCGDGTTGLECQGCGMVRSDADEPCEKGQNGEPCFAVDGPNNGAPVCLMCERDM